MSMTQCKVFVNEDVTGDHVAVLMVNPSVIEVEDGELCPALQLTPEAALNMAQALVTCAEQIVRAKEDGV